MRYAQGRAIRGHRAPPSWRPGPLYGGELAIDATCETPLVDTAPGVYLLTESGFDDATLA